MAANNREAAHTGSSEVVARRFESVGNGATGVSAVTTSFIVIPTTCVHGDVESIESS